MAVINYFDLKGDFQLAAGVSVAKDVSLILAAGGLDVDTLPLGKIPLTINPKVMRIMNAGVFDAIHSMIKSCADDPFHVIDVSKPNFQDDLAQSLTAITKTCLAEHRKITPVYLIEYNR